MIKYIIILILIVSPASAVKIIGGSEEERYIVQTSINITDYKTNSRIFYIEILNFSSTDTCNVSLGRNHLLINDDGIFGVSKIYLNNDTRYYKKDIFLNSIFHEIGHTYNMLYYNDYSEESAIKYASIFELRYKIYEILNKDR